MKLRPALLAGTAGLVSAKRFCHDNVWQPCYHRV
jgi:hypothetical protein